MTDNTEGDGNMQLMPLCLERRLTALINYSLWDNSTWLSRQKLQNAII
jgi:hypothetical protein